MTPARTASKWPPLHPHVGVRNSKNPAGPALLLPSRAWTEFVAHLAGR
ncbi:DUF397 domain-containing protein [Streptomyces broussonetiae]